MIFIFIFAVKKYYEGTFNLIVTYLYYGNIHKQSESENSLI